MREKKMYKSYKTAVILGLACANALQAAVTVQLSLSIDPITQTFQAYANVIDASNQTLGLHGLEFNITGTGSVSILSSTLQMPAPIETLDNVATYQKGFSAFRSNGLAGQSIRAFQQNINQLSTTGSGRNNILEGFGESASTENNGLNASTTIAQPALIASGSYTGSAGSISIAGSTDLTTLLPATLPTATVGGSSFATFSPTSVSGQTFTVPFNSTWTGAANDGNWLSSNNWNGVVPGFTASGDVANFTSGAASPTAVSLNGNKTVGTLTFNNLNPYTLNQGTMLSTLTLNNGVSNSIINDSGGSHTINVPVNLATNTSITVLNLPTTLTINGNLSGSGSITKLGLGTLSLTGTLSYAGSTTVNTGRLKTVKAIQNGADITVAGGTLEVLASGASPAVTSAALVTTSGSGKIELHNNDLISNYGAGSSNYASIVAQVKSGLTILGGAGTTGVTSSEVESQSIPGTLLGVVDDGAVGGAITSLSGFLIPHPESSTLIKYTWFGDCNLDGAVDGSDYILLDTGFTAGGTLGGWVFGDFDYNGVVDDSDYILIDSGFVNQQTILPEPGMIGMIGLGALGQLCRRRRAPYIIR